MVWRSQVISHMIQASALRDADGARKCQVFLEQKKLGIRLFQQETGPLLEEKLLSSKLSVVAYSPPITTTVSVVV